MELSINTEGLSFICAGEATPVNDYKTGKAKTDPNGIPLFLVKTLIMSGDDADMYRIKVPGKPAVTPGLPVRVAEFSASQYDIEGKVGVAYRVARMEPAGPPARGDKGGATS